MENVCRRESFLYLDGLPEIDCPECGSHLLVAIEEAKPMWDSRLYCSSTDCGIDFGRVEYVMLLSGTLSESGRESLKNKARRVGRRRVAERRLSE